MAREELLKKWDELTSTYTDKEVKLEAFIQRWLDGDSGLSSESIQELIDTVTKQIDELKTAANQAISEYTRLGKEEMLRNEGLVSAKKSVKSQFGVSPDEMIITGGVLSSDASESHLTGRNKTPEELEADRQYALAEIRTRVANREISLAEASKLKHDVNVAYGYADPIQGHSNGMNK